MNLLTAYSLQVVSIVPPDLKFAVDEMSGGDPRFVGVKWCGPCHCKSTPLSVDFIST